MTDVLITGGSGGIGAALVRRLTDEGRQVVFTFCQHKEKALALAKATGAEPIYYDQSVSGSVSEVAALVRERTLDALVNNAAQPVPRQLLLKTDPEQFVAYQVAALQGIFALARAFAARAKERGTGGAIVNVLSAVTLGIPPAKQATYVTSKHALLGLTRSMAVEFIRYGVRVNAVSPGMTRTEFNAELPAPFIEQLEATLPMKRLASAPEVAAVIRFLISPDATYITGANIPVCGGQAC